MADDKKPASSDTIDEAVSEAASLEADANAVAEAAEEAEDETLKERAHKTATKAKAALDKTQIPGASEAVMQSVLHETRQLRAELKGSIAKAPASTRDALDDILNLFNLW